MRRIGSLTEAAFLLAAIAVAPWAWRDELVHAQQVIEIGVEVVEEDGIEKHAADLRQRRRAIEPAPPCDSSSARSSARDSASAELLQRMPTAKTRVRPRRMAGLNG
jgi:hypothetical protein